MYAVTSFKRILIISISFFIFGVLPKTSVGQYWEIGGLLGGSNYTGDLATQMVLKETRPTVSLWGRYNMSKFFSYRFGASFGRIQGADSLVPANKLRDLSFRTDIWEINNILEFNYQPFGNDPLSKPYTAYVFTGINLLYFNPMAQFEGKWYALQPLGTEGQNLDGGKGRYSRVSVSLPIGGGVKYRAGNWIWGFEVGYRMAFTDYLDDVSSTYPDMDALKKKDGQLAVYFSDPSYNPNHATEPRSKKGDMRGTTHIKDWYAFAGITLSYRFSPIRCAWNQKPKSYNFID